MKRTLVLGLIILSYAVSCYGQQPPPFTCGETTVMDHLFRTNPSIKTVHQQIEQQLHASKISPRPQGTSPHPLGFTQVTLPVVVHIIHNGGPENISDAQVYTAIQHLNEAYAKTGYYTDPGGTSPAIQFCMAQRDPSNQPTNGITRDVSPYTVMTGLSPDIDDLHVKDINRWNPLCYINIWVVKSIPGAVAGFAYLPFAHGTIEDGIVVEADFFGTSYANDVVPIHEMGHYLGLYHTFENGCTNNDCSLDGDRVCDTPPTQSTAYIACGQTINSCSTDALSGFSTDQNDPTKDYMGYGNLGCMKIFTQGQVDRMRWHLENIRTSLLQCKSCMAPCPDPVVASFTLPPSPIQPGQPVVFTNGSTNAIGYTWYVNGIQQNGSPDLSYTFPSPGAYTIRLVAQSGNTVCYDDEKTSTVQVICPVSADFTPDEATIGISTSIHLTSTDGSARTTQWTVDGQPAGTGTGFDFTGAIAGQHTVQFTAGNGVCTSSHTGHVIVIDPADTCPIHTFQERIGSNLPEVAWDAQIDPAGNYVISGFTRSFGSPLGLAAKLTPAGQPIWSRTLGDAPDTHLYNGAVTSDGGSIHAGNGTETFTTGKSFVVSLFKLDGAGNQQWAKNYHNSTGVTSIFGRVIQTRDGGYAICNFYGIGSSWPVLLIRLDPLGNILWSRTYLNDFTNEDTRVMESGGQLIASTWYFDPIDFRFKTAIASIDETTGNLSWAKSYTYPAGYCYPGRVSAYGSQLLVSMLYGDINTSAQHSGFMLIDQQGNLASSYALNDPAQSGNYIVSDAIAMDGANIAFFAQEHSNATDDDAVLIKATPQGQVLAAKKYPLPGTQLLYSLRQTPDMGIIAVGSTHETNSNNTDLYLLKTDRQLRLYQPGQPLPGCTAIDLTPTMDDAGITTTSIVSAAYNVAITTSDYTTSAMPISLGVNSFCGDGAACTTLAISGSDTACNSRSNLAFTAIRAPGCTQPVEWSIDNTFADITTPSDSSILLHFRKTGTTWLHARLTANCSITMDSILVFVPPSPDTVDLGPDISLCTTSTIRLNAGAGFRSYKWQDGSIDSTLTAYIPGLYYVTARDYCDQPHRDSLSITQIPSPAFHLGPDDPEDCIGDSINLVAPAGFNNYSWSPSDGLDNIHAASVLASPEKETVYTCIAEANPGCTVTDSIRVRIKTICRPGIYFPSAFTPDGNGTNDRFRAIIAGVTPQSWRLAVYNRQGLCVFESKDPSSGWDGKFNGIPQQIGAYLWYCTYQLPGSKPSLQKGTLVLVR